MYCPHCGKPTEPGATFCVRCGGSLPLSLAPAPGPAPATPGKQKQTSSPLPIVAVVVVVALLALCCCCLVAGGGVTWYAAQAPTPTLTPTRVPRAAEATRAPTSAPRPASTPRPTNVPQPTNIPGTPESVGEMKIYMNTAHGFSIQYPAGWTVQEGSSGPSFGRPTSPSAGVSIGVVSKAGTLGSEQAFADLYVSQLKNSSFPDLETVSVDTRVFNGAEWRYLVLTCTYNGQNTQWDLYAKIHNTGIGYIFVGVTGVITYNEDTKTFTRMMESFRFLQ